jgi:hypothetical protein
VDADSPQHTGERNFLSDYSQSSAQSPPSNKSNVAGDIYPRRTSPITGEGKFDRPQPPYIVANPHASFTKDAKIMIPKKEKPILSDR